MLAPRKDVEESNGALACLPDFRGVRMGRACESEYSASSGSTASQSSNSFRANGMALSSCCDAGVTEDREEGSEELLILMHARRNVRSSEGGRLIIDDVGSSARPAPLFAFR